MIEKDLVTMLLKKSYFGGEVELPIESDYSNLRTRNLIMAINDKSEETGFRIESLYDDDYFLKIYAFDKFNIYLNQNNLNLLKQKERSKIILLNLFQTESFITINTLSNIVNVSRNTLIRDLTEVEDYLKEYQLSLYRKRHYGIKVLGEEMNYRRAFSALIKNNNFNILPSSDYTTYLGENNRIKIKKMLLELMEREELAVNDIALNNLVQHIEVLIYRTSKQNYIINNTINIEEHEIKYLNVAKQIRNWIYEQFYINLPNSEINLLSAHIAGKTTISNLNGQEKDTLKQDIEKVLITMDEDFSTSFENDELLKSNLLMHVYPLMKRMYHNLELENPFIEKIYSKYSNVFLYSYRFSELITEKYDYSLSRDEVGYIALHFATHIEREKRVILNKYKKITIICSTGRGSAMLLKIKLQDIFPLADIQTSSLNKALYENRKLPDLFISTLPIENDFTHVPVIRIKELLDDREVDKIKKTLFISHDNRQINEYRQTINFLFSRKLFYRVKADDYLMLIKDMANDVSHMNYAHNQFPQSVIDRELMFTTIYNNGVSGPHSTNFYAIKNCISVAILDKPITYSGKEVQIIFLINLQKGHLFLHTEVSKFVLSVIENEDFRHKVLTCKDYESFIQVLRDYKER